MPTSVQRITFLVSHLPSDTLKILSLGYLISAGSLNNNSLFTLVGEKSLDYIKIRDWNIDPDEEHLEFYFDDNNQGYNLKRYTTNDNESQRYEMDYDDISIFIPDYKEGDIIKISEANDRFGLTNEDFFNQVNKYCLTYKSCKTCNLFSSQSKLFFLKPRFINSSITYRYSKTFFCFFIPSF